MNSEHYSESRFILYTIDHFDASEIFTNWDGTKAGCCSL
jgi:hypothetical protein